MNDRHLSPGQIRNLLGAVSDDHALVHPRRAELRAAVLEEFGDASESRLDGPTRADPPAAVDLDDLVPLAFRPERPSHRRRYRVLAAAAVFVVVVGGLAAARQRLSPDEVGVEATDGSEPVTVEARRLVPDGSPVPAALPAGRYQTDVIGGGIELEVTTGVLVLEERAGRLALGLDDNEGRIVVVDVDPETSLGDLVDDLVAEGWATVVTTPATMGSSVVENTEIRLTPAAYDTFGCKGVSACVALGPLTLTSHATINVREQEGPSGERIWWLLETHLSRFTNDPLFELSQSAAATLTFLDN